MDISTLRVHRNDGLPFRISLEAVNKSVGLVALGLPFALLLASQLGDTCVGIDSISHYYYTTLGGDLLVGALCFIGMLLAFFYKLPIEQDGSAQMVDGYLGHQVWDMRLARFAGACAFGVALFPTAGAGCEDFAGTIIRTFVGEATGGHAQVPPDQFGGQIGFDFWRAFGIEGLLTKLHYASAGGMFAVLAYFSLVVFPRPQSVAAFEQDQEKTLRKTRRNLFYRLCGVAIVIAFVALVYQFLIVRPDAAKLALWNGRDLTFWFEALGLVAFGLSWSLKGRVFEMFRDPEEANPKMLAQERAA